VDHDVEHLPNLGIGLPVDRVRPLLLRRALTGDPDTEELQLDAVNRRGRQITVRVACSPVPGAAAEPSGAIIVMEATPRTG
jgi:two-component system, chemotaxis family, CheB/CheR fusion protein